MTEPKRYDPFDLFGVECGEGWKSLYQPIIDRVNEINAAATKEDAVIEGLANAPRARILQIKEKFGQLRIYLSAPEPYYRELIDMVDKAERASAKTCEDCGSPGQSRSGGWIRTLCDVCNNSH